MTQVTDLSTHGSERLRVTVAIKFSFSPMIHHGRGSYIKIWRPAGVARGRRRGMPSIMDMRSRLRRAVIISACAVALTLGSLTAANAAQPHGNAATHATSVMQVTTQEIPFGTAAYATPADAGGGTCSNLPPNLNEQVVWRCNGVTWISTSCAQGEYNADPATGPYNFWEAVNLCPTRVWIHQYTYPEDTDPQPAGGWSTCLKVPTSAGFVKETFPVTSEYRTPNNIMVSANPNQCP